MADASGSPRGAARAAWIVAALAALPYLLLPSNPLLYDAPLAVLGNQAVQHGSFADLFRVDFWGFAPDAAVTTRSYRPLVSLTYWLQAQTVGNSPTIYHAVDVGLHALAAALVTLLLARLGVRRPWLIPAALLYAWHPVLTDAVSSVVGRADVMAAAAFAGAVVLHLDARAHPAPTLRRAGSIALLAAAMLMKEYAVTFPFLLVAIDLARCGAGESTDPLRAGRPVWLGGFVALAAYLALRLAMFGALGGVPSLAVDDHPLVGEPLDVRWGTAATLVPLSLRLLVAPFALNHHYRMGTLPIADGLLDPRALIGIAISAALVALAVWSATRARTAAPAIAVALFAFPLAPSLNTVSLAGVLFAERFLYLPAVGVALVAGRGLQRIAPRVPLRALVGASLVVALVGAGCTARRVTDWRSLERLARSSLANYPEGSEVWKQLGLTLQQDGRHEEAVEALGRSLELNEINAQAWKHYADSLSALGRHDEAVEAWRRTTELSPRGVWRLWRGRGDAERRAGRHAEAARSYEIAHDTEPADPGSLFGLARALLDDGRPAEAYAALDAGDAARRNDPGALEPLLMQTRIAAAREDAIAGRAREARDHARAVAEHPSAGPEALFAAGVVAILAGDEPAGREWIARATAADPQLLARRHAAALAAQQEGRLRDAETLFRDLLAARPDSAPTWFNLGRLLLQAGRTDSAAGALRRGLELVDDPRARELLRRAEAGAD